MAVSPTTHFENQAAGYEAASRRFPWTWLRRRECAAVMASLGDVRGKRALDLGCGAGYYTRALLAAGAAQVLAVDASPAMIAQLPTEKVLGRVADACSVQLDEPFSAAVCAGMLEFVADAGAALAHFRGQALADARLVLLVPEHGFWGRRYAAYHRRHDVNVMLYSKEGLSVIANGAGWRIESCRRVWPFSLVVSLRPEA